MPEYLGWIDGVYRVEDNVSTRREPGIVLAVGLHHARDTLMAEHCRVIVSGTSDDVEISPTDAEHKGLQ